MGASVRSIDRLSEDWLLATETHKIEARIWRRVQRDDARVILVTSASRGEGKSTTVALLSTTLALHPERKILAIDCDLREPQLASHFEVTCGIGVGAVLLGKTDLATAVVKTSLPNLDLLLPVPEVDKPELLLRTTECTRLLAEARQSYDLTLIDVPALIPVADASTLLPLVEGVILVGMAGRTTRAELRRAREICVGLEAKIIGMIIGNLRVAVPEHGYGGSYYAYKGNGAGRGGDAPRGT
jgi:capsular exopolysaccharide synthesis family protein